MTLQVRIDGEWVSLAALQDESMHDLKTYRDRLTGILDGEIERGDMQPEGIGVLLARTNAEIAMREEERKRKNAVQRLGLDED